MEHLEKIHVCLIEPDDVDWIKKETSFEIMGVISFGDSEKFTQLLASNLPHIYSHSGYWNDEGRYIESTEQGPLQVFLLESKSPIRLGTYKSISYSESEEFLFGSLDIEEKGNNNGDELISITQEAYAQMYELMKKLGKHNFVRIGNYVSDILGPTQITVDGNLTNTNRYKAFCVGRSKSLDELFKLPNEQLPTATGIGNHYEQQGLKIFFIASTRADVSHHKNPKQTDPALYDKNAHGVSGIAGQLSLPKFNRSTSLSAYKMLFVGGTASILGQEVVHEGNVVKQTIQSLQNIFYTMEEASKNTGIDFTTLPIILKVFIKNKHDFDAVKMAIESKDHNPLKNTIIDTIYTHGDVCRSQWLVEISCETMNQEIAKIILEHKLERFNTYSKQQQKKMIRKMCELELKHE